MLEDHFIEVRLHTDQGAAAEGNRALQEELVQNLAIPYYIVINPQSKEQVGGRVIGATTVGTFREFLAEAVDASERVSKLNEDAR